MEKNYNTLTGNFFTFRNQKCDCKIEITYNQNGNKIIYFKMAAIPDKYYYIDHKITHSFTLDN